LGVGEHSEWSFNVESEWLTATEAAHYLKVQPRTILKWAKEGRIPAHALSGCKRVTWRFLKSELDGAMLKPPSAAGLGGSIEQQN
jgi:excisionase family DNA binding protein